MIFVLIVKFVYLEIFQKPSGGLCIAARRLMPTASVWGVSRGQRLAVGPRTARRRKWMREFWVIFMNCLAVMNFRQPTRVCWLDFLVLCFVEDFWSVRKMGKGSYKMMRVVFVDGMKW